MGVAAFVVFCVRNNWLFSFPVHEDGDFAANSILVNKAVHYHLLVGNYSREGFHHPGPAFLYVMSFGQDFFYSWLHVVPARYNGQVLGVLVLSSVILALVTIVFLRHSQSWTSALLALSVIVLMTGGTMQWGLPWFPNLYQAPFLLAVIAGASVASGALRDLPAFAIAVGLLVHGHVSFFGIMGLYVIGVCVTWLAIHRGRYRAQLGAVAKHLMASAGIVAVFALPIVLELIFHWPGQFGQYWHYSRTTSGLHPHSPSSVVSYVERFWPGGRTGIALILAAFVATAFLAAKDHNRSRRAFVLCTLGGAVLATMEVGIYAAKGVDYLKYTYTGYFYYCIPATIVALLVLEGICRLREAMRERGSGHGRRALRFVPFLVSAAVGAVVLAMQPSSYSGYRGDPALPRAVRAIEGSSLRQGRAVAIVLDQVGTAAPDWPDAAGVLLAASRAGLMPCVSNRAYAFILTSDYICSSSQVARRWTIVVEQANVPVPAGSGLIFRARSIEVFTSASSA